MKFNWPLLLKKLGCDSDLHSLGLASHLLQVVGNLVYYRYINSAIVAPDAFDIVSVGPDQKLNNNQRRNLASIAKILQFAASKKGQGSYSYLSFLW